MSSIYQQTYCRVLMAVETVSVSLSHPLWTFSGEKKCTLCSFSARTLRARPSISRWVHGSYTFSTWTWLTPKRYTDPANIRCAIEQMWFCKRALERKKKQCYELEFMRTYILQHWRLAKTFAYKMQKKREPTATVIHSPIHRFPICPRMKFGKRCTSTTQHIEQNKK